MRFKEYNMPGKDWPQLHCLLQAKKLPSNLIKIDEVQPAAKPRKPVRTVAQSSSSSSTASSGEWQIALNLVINIV